MDEIPGAVIDALLHWDITGPVEVRRPPRGTNNDTALVTAGSDQWVLRTSRNLSMAQVRAEGHLLDHLRGTELPFAVPIRIPTAGGGTVVDTPRGPTTLCRAIPGVRPDLSGDASLRQFGAALEMLDDALAGVPPQDAPQDWRRGPLHVHPAVTDVPTLAGELKTGGISVESAQLLEDQVEKVAATWTRVTDELPRQVVHGDLAASNVVVDEHTGVVTGLLDFELAGLDFRVQDLVIALVQSAALDGPSWQRRTTALIEGATSKRQLSPAEIDAIPHLIAARAVASVLWRAGRWREHLNGLDAVVARCGQLEATTEWLTLFGDRLRDLIESTGG